MTKDQAIHRERPEWALSPENFIKEMDAVPLFMSSLPKKGEESIELTAIQSLIYDGTPEEVAANFKNQGNEMFMDGKKYYQHAMNYYTKGIEQDCSDQALNATLYCNRAAVHLELENYRQAIKDCEQTLKWELRNIKAHYRAARALLALDKLPETFKMIEDGLQIENDNVTLLALRDKTIQRQQSIAKTVSLRAQATDQVMQREQAIKQAVEQATLTRGIRITQTRDKLPSEYADYHPIYEAATDTLTFPAIVLYPEHAQSDFIAKFDVDTTFEEQLQPILESPAPWDPSFIYQLANIDVYFVSNLQSKGNSERSSTRQTLVKVDKQDSLHSVLKSKGIVVADGIVEFILLPRSGTAFTEKYIKQLA